MKLLRLLCIIMLAAAAAACNNEVFVDGTLPPDPCEYTIAGDGGSVELDIPVRGLEYIDIDHFSDSQGLSYYDSEGNLIPADSPASEVALICWTGNTFIFKVAFDKGHMTISCDENASGDVLKFAIRASYDYTTRIIHVNVTPGREQNVDEIEYHGRLEVENGIDSDTRRSRFVNKGDRPVPVNIRPFYGIRAQYIVIPEMDWAKYMQVEMPLPVYTDGSWSLGKPAEVKLNVTTHTTPTLSDVVTSLEVPPFSEVVVDYTVTFSKATGYGHIQYLNPESGRLLTTLFRCEAVEPTGFHIDEITINDAE